MANNDVNNQFCSSETELIILPARIPLNLQDDEKVTAQMRFTGDVKVEDLLRKFIKQYKIPPPNYLLQKLKVPQASEDHTNSKVLDCSIFMLSNSKKLVLFMNYDNTQQPRETFSKLMEVIQSCIKKTGSWLCFLLFDCDKKQADVLEKEQNFRQFIAAQDFDRHVHFIGFSRKNNKHEVIDAQDVMKIMWQNFESVDYLEHSELTGHLLKNVPQEKDLYFTEKIFKTKGDSISISLDINGLETFYYTYLCNCQTELITIPDFDRVKNTKMYPKSLGCDRFEDYSCPGLLPGSSLFDYVGEFERFWPRFHIWFRNPTGLLLHSYSQKEILSLLENQNIFSFEFDWLYCMDDKFVVFEITLAAKSISQKLAQVFDRHVPVMKILFFFSLRLMLATEPLDEFFRKTVRFVTFFAGMDHDKVCLQIDDSIKGSGRKLLNNKYLDQMYFVGFNYNQNNNQEPFWKFDKTSRKLVACCLQPVKLNESEQILLKNIKSLFAFSYFTNQNDSFIQPFHQRPALLESRYLDCQKQFVSKFLCKTNEREARMLDKLDVILSPQQFGILMSNPKLLLCPAEPGSGKTQLLLAKALQSAIDESVDWVYFCIPVPQNKSYWKRVQLSNLVTDFVTRNQSEFGSKFQLISDSELVRFCSKPSSELQRTVLLVDEFHYGYNESFTLKDENFRNLALKAFPYLKHCWLASVTMHYLYMRNHELSRFIPQELLSTRPLNVQYRSAKHISEFCSKIVQINRKGKFSSPRVHGIFLSKNQLEVELRRFSKMQETKSALGIESLRDLAKSLKLKESNKFDRWVVVFCLKYEKIFWEKLFQKFDFDEKQVTFVLFEDGLSSCVFTGGEVHSVLLLIDGPIDDDYSKDMDKYNDMILLACSRAQYELVIYVNEKMNGVYENLSSCKEQTKNFVSKIQDSPTDQGIRNFLVTVESKIPDNENLKSLVKNCNISFIPTNINMDWTEDLLTVVFCEECEKPLWSKAVHALFCPNFPHENNVHILTCNTDLLITEINSPKPVKSILCFIDLSNKALCGRDASLIKKVLSEVNNILLTEIVLFVSTEMTHSVKALQQSLEIGQNVQVTVVPFWKAGNFYRTSSDFSKSLTFSLYNLETKLEEIKPFLQGWINRQILLLLGLKQSSSIIKILLGSDSVKNPQNVLAGAIIHSLNTECMDMLRWVLTIMEKTGLTNPPKSHHITSCAVFKPGMLPICLKYFEKWGVLNFEDPGTTLNIGDEKSGVLALFCYANVDISDANFWKYLQKVPVDSLLTEFMGWNALQHAICHGNVESIEKLLRSYDWQRQFLSSTNDGWCKVMEFARKCEFLGIENLIYWRCIESVVIDYFCVLFFSTC